jgi:hypothetical protein
MDVVGYIQRLWGIHIDRGRSSIEQGKVRKQTDVPLQKSNPMRYRQHLWVTENPSHK